MADKKDKCVWGIHDYDEHSVSYTCENENCKMHLVEPDFEKQAIGMRFNESALYEATNSEERERAISVKGYIIFWECPGCHFRYWDHYGLMGTEIIRAKNAGEEPNWLEAQEFLRNCLKS